MDTIEKVYCTGHDNNDALVSDLTYKNNCYQMAMAAMMNQNVCSVLNLKIPSTSTIHDVTYTVNMDYADFYPELLIEHECVKYATVVANDEDGYEGIQFCRWVADVMTKKENID